MRPEFSIAETPDSSWVTALAFSPDSRQLATVGYDTIVRVWETETGKETAKFIGHTERLLAISFSPDGSTIASGGADGTIRLWDAPAAAKPR